MAGREGGARGRRCPPPSLPQYGDLGVAGTDLWLAASGDQRISVWASDWLRDRCELLDWLSFPAPATLEVSLQCWAGWGAGSVGERPPGVCEAWVPFSAPHEADYTEGVGLGALGSILSTT